MLDLEKNKVFIQIGTNDGRDEFNSLVKNLSPSKVILIEPLNFFNEKINMNYSGLNNIFIENVAITNVEKGKVKLVLPKNSINGKAANGVFYGDKGYSLLPMDDWGDDLHEYEANSMTFNQICEKYNIFDIHYLQIDTEGYDTEIIKSIDFNKINIDIIKYENWTFGEDCFKRHGDNYKLYGKNGMDTVSELLNSLGYTLIQESADTVAIKNIMNEY